MEKRSKEQVINIGQELFRTQGYHNTGTEDILQKSDYPRSSFYYHFKSKEGFATMVLENYGNNSEKFYRSILTNDKLGSPLARLHHFSEIMKEGAVKKKFSSECLIQKLSIECAGINENFRKSTNMQMEKLLNVVEECIAEGQKIKEIREDISAKEMAEYFHSQLYGAFILSRLKQNGEIMGNGLKLAIDNMKA